MLISTSEQDCGWGFGMGWMRGDGGCEGAIKVGMRKLLGIMGMFIVLIVVMVSWVYA